MGQSGPAPDDVLLNVSRSRSALYELLSQLTLFPPRAESVEALRSGELRGAFSDLFSAETLTLLREIPPPDDELLQALNRDFHRLFRVPGDGYTRPYEAVYTDSEFRFSDPDGFFSLSETDTERVRARSVATWRPGGDIWVAAGAEWQEDEVTNDTNFGPTLTGSSRQDWAVFAQSQATFGRTRLDFGLRQDEDEFFGGQLSPRGGIVVDLSQTMQLFGSYGEGFRAPSLGELFFPFFGNPDLLPEESRSVEAGFRYTGATWWAGAAWFDNDYENLIDSDPITFLAVNIGRAETTGWELELGYRKGLVEARANVTLLDAVDLEKGEALLRRAEEKANLLVAIRPQRFIFQVVGRYVGERFDLDPVTFGRTMNDDYLVADIAVTWQASETLAPYGRVGNVAGKEYEEVLGFPAPGRTWSLGLEVRWP